MIRIRRRSAFLEIACTRRMAFSKRSWPFVLATALPRLLCAGRRRVSRLAAFSTHARSVSAYDRFPSEGEWPPGALSSVRSQLQHGLDDPDLSGLRDAHELARLPDSEREPRTKLWNDVRDLTIDVGAKSSAPGSTRRSGRPPPPSPTSGDWRGAFSRRRTGALP